MNTCKLCGKDTENKHYCSRECHNKNVSLELIKSHADGKRDYKNMHSGALNGWETRKINGTDKGYNNCKTNHPNKYKGLTKETDSSGILIKRGKTQSHTLKEQFKSGKIPWNKIPTDKLFVENCQFAMCSLRNRLMTIKEYVDYDESLGNRARELEKLGIMSMDALHIACAEKAKADLFVTCDDILIKKCESNKKKIKVKVLALIEFINREVFNL